MPFPNAETPLDAIPNLSIGGCGSCAHAIGSTMALKNAVGERITTYCIFDSDHHTSAEQHDRYNQARERGITLHIWDTVLDGMATHQSHHDPKLGAGGANEEARRLLNARWTQGQLMSSTGGPTIQIKTLADGFCLTSDDCDLNCDITRSLLWNRAYLHINATACVGRESADPSPLAVASFPSEIASHFQGK